MFIVESYSVAVGFCIVTMLCWGSWANTQKAVGQSWRFELFYWDYALGVLAASLAFALTMGSVGAGGRGFVAEPIGTPFVLFVGVAFIVAAVVLDSLACYRISCQGGNRGRTGLVLAVLSGVLMGYFYRSVAAAHGQSPVD